MRSPVRRSSAGRLTTGRLPAPRPWVRPAAAACLLALALTACGSPAPSEERARAPRPAPSATSAGPEAEPSRAAGAAGAPSGAPTLAPGPAGLVPVFSHGPRTRGKVVALTFDADMTADQGPRAAAGERFDNPELIATLRRLKVPATVFMTGRWAEEYPDQARAIGRDPLFEVANHSYSHHAYTADCYGLPRLDRERMRADVERAFQALRAAGVPEPRPYFRFPGGCYDLPSLKALTPTGVTAVQWDVVSGDAFATDAEAVARDVLDQVRPGSVVVMHCTRSAAPATEAAVREIVPALRERGYRFVKVSELIGVASEQR